MSTSQAGQEGGVMSAPFVYLTVEQVAAGLGVTPRYVYTGLKRGRLRGSKLAGRWRFRPEWVMDWVEGRAPMADTPSTSHLNTRRMLELKRLARRG